MAGLFLLATHFGICIGSSRGKSVHSCSSHNSASNVSRVRSHVHLSNDMSVAQYIVESARQRPAKRRVSAGGRKSLHQKLYELYMEECEKEPELKVRARQDRSVTGAHAVLWLHFLIVFALKNLRRNVNLLEKLVSQESVSCLVVNLYPGNEGYSLMLRGKNGSGMKTMPAGTSLVLLFPGATVVSIRAFSRF